MNEFVSMRSVIEACYFIAAILFIFGLKRMSSPVTARGGIIWAGAGMVVATLVTFLYPGMGNYALMMVAIFIGGVLAWVSGKKVAMTDMPQMIALYNGMGGGAAAAIAAVELLSGEDHGLVFGILAVLGGMIGAVSFSGSLIAFAKLQGIMKGSFRFRGQQLVNLLILFVTVVLAGIIVYMHGGVNLVVVFFVLALVLGVTMTLPIGGADMPVVISLYNALTGLAVAFEGFVLQNAAMIIAGTVVGSAGTLLTQLMAKAMNRSLANVLFSGFGDEVAEGGEISGSMKPIDATDVAVNQRGICNRRRRFGNWRQRRRQPGGAYRPVQPDLRYADPERRPREECHRDQAGTGRGLLRNRKCAVLPRSDENALRRRPGYGQRVDSGSEVTVTNSGTVYLFRLYRNKNK
jgi:NAD(P) transhydrogenase subunit beta